MPDVRMVPGTFFERGIDSITFKGRKQSSDGPSGQQQLAPAAQGQRPQIEQLLAAHNMETYLDDAVRPRIDDRDLLMPHRFRKALDAALLETRHRAKELQTSDPQAAKVLNRAVRVMDEVIDLRDLFQMYRSVLYQG